MGGPARVRIMLVGAVSVCAVASQLIVATGVQAAAPSNVSSSPPDRTAYVGRTTGQAGLGSSVLGVYVTDPSLSSNSRGGSEPSIAVNPANPNQIAITRFTFAWNNNADLLYSADGGLTWTNQSTIPPPPGVAGTAGCPCDQTIDYGRDGRLYGTFLTADRVTGATTVVTGSTTNPTNASSWSWNGNPAQLTSGTRTMADQPQLLVNVDPTNTAQDDVYVAYDDFGAGPDARVAASYGANPVNITVDNKAGTESPLATNPGLRLATEPQSGAVFALYEQSTGAAQPKTVTYKLNRSTDRGATWTLNGSVDGLTVDTVTSDQAPGFKFGTVNALLGGVDHAAVDPTNGDVYVVYGQHVSVGNQIKIRRLQANAAGGLNVGPATNVSLSTNAALPSVAVSTDGTIGVLYDSWDSFGPGGIPTFSAHLARSTNHGASFSDVVLESFQSPVADNGDPRQRVLGDYQQIKAVGTTFYGVFSGNRNGFGSPTSTIDPIFFKARTANEVGVAGTDSSLWRLQDIPPPTPFTSLGGFMLAAPAVVSVPDLSGTQPGSPIYIATGGDHSLWVRSQTQPWQPLASSPTFCIDNPAGVVVQSKPAGSLIFVVACQGGDHGLWFAEEPISPGTLPNQSLVFQSLGGHLTAGPAVAAIDPLGAATVNDELTFFVDGLDGNVWTRTPNSAGWSQTPWRCIGHPAVSTVVSPTLVLASEASLFACQGTDGHLWVAINFGGPGAWFPAADKGGLLVDGPGAAADPEGPVVYAEGLDGAVWRFDGTWTSLGGGVLHGVGAAAVQSLNATGSPLGGSWGLRSP